MPPSSRGLTPLVCAMAGWLCACSDSSAPLGQGNVVHVDADASSVPVGDSDGDVVADSPFAPKGGPYAAPPDAYAPLASCSQCACDAGTFCYGGSPSTALSACDWTL